MPEYLAPGVFVEEISFRAKSIEGVGTSVAGIVGPLRFGPVRGRPEVVTSFAELTRIYGDDAPLTLGGTGVPNHTAIAARAFFDNGGKQLFVSRIIQDGNRTDARGANGSATFARRRDANGWVTFQARFPGSGGNLTLEILWRDSENLLRTEVTSQPANGEVVLLEATGVPASAKGPGATLEDDRFPIRITAVVAARAQEVLIQSDWAEITDNAGVAVTPAELDGMLLRAELPAGAVMTRVFARAPASGPLAAGTAMVLRLGEVTNLTRFTDGPDWGTLILLRGTYNPATNQLTIIGSQNGLPADVTLPLPALATRPGAARSLLALRRFDLDVLRNGEPIHSFTDIDLAPASARSLDKVLTATPARRYDALTQPVACTLTLPQNPTSAHVLEALTSLFDPVAANPPQTSGQVPRQLIHLHQGDGSTPGTDGNVPGQVDYAGETDEIKGSTGLAALEEIEDIAIVCAPASAAHAAAGQPHQAVMGEIQKHVNKMRYRVGLVDPGQGWSLAQVREFASHFDDSRLALYFPWLTIADPTGASPEVMVPPAGFVAGIYANTDVNRGVHKAPANEPILGALRPEIEINRFQQELLNPNGINCLRSFPNRGLRVWGGRTRSSDPEWKYVNVRRYFLYLERSIDKSTQWAVFEPNGEALWANIRSAVEDFLFNEWKNGRLLGATPKAAYFVRCDRSTMTQNDIDNGRLVCLVGVAALKPAEFVIFRIGQKTADA
ncbi:MAG: phage tail sheath subtilisin-like domain-containing protein [Thermodesulfobacteriota bacterium]